MTKKFYIAQVMYFVGEKFKSEIDEGNIYELEKFEM